MKSENKVMWILYRKESLPSYNESFSKHTICVCPDEDTAYHLMVHDARILCRKWKSAADNKDKEDAVRIRKNEDGTITVRSSEAVAVFSAEKIPVYDSL